MMKKLLQGDQEQYANFETYYGTVRPPLEEVFNNVLNRTLEGIVMRNPIMVLDGLKAGKKIRGCLSCLVSEALGGGLDYAIPRAVAIELIQAATLIHDDFVDQDRTRRDMPATWTLEGARRAVLIGDVLFANAIEMMTCLGTQDGYAVSHAIAKLSEGALNEPLDPFFFAQEVESGRFNGELYEKIIHLKTAILFGIACQLGAISARAGDEMIEVSYQYGLRVGEAYQIADDAKEVRFHLLRQSIEPREMAGLAPALLHFSDSTCPFVLSVLKGEETDLNGPAQRSFELVAKLMERDIDRRLQAAVSEIATHCAKTLFGDLMLRTPWDIITMFNKSPQ